MSHLALIRGQTLHTKLSHLIVSITPSERYRFFRLVDEALEAQQTYTSDPRPSASKLGLEPASLTRIRALFHYGHLGRQGLGSRET